MKHFIDYVYNFYGTGGIYDMQCTKLQIYSATKQLAATVSPVFYDSIDREKVRDIMIENYGLTFPGEAWTLQPIKSKPYATAQDCLKVD